MLLVFQRLLREDPVLREERIRTHGVNNVYNSAKSKKKDILPPKGHTREAPDNGHLVHEAMPKYGIWLHIRF